MKQQATPYLTFNGNARHALDFYQSVFNAELQVQTYGEADMETPPEADKLVMHARLTSGPFSLMAADTFPNHGNVKFGNNAAFMIECDSVEEATTLFNALKDGGNVYMDLQDTFWNAKYGKVQDQFGVVWDVNYSYS